MERKTIQVSVAIENLNKQCITKCHGKHSLRLNRPDMHQNFGGQLCVSNAVEVQKCKVGTNFGHVKSMVLIIIENTYS